MAKFIILAPNGVPLALMEQPGPMPVGAIEVPEGASLEALSRKMLIEGGWQDRPAAELVQMPGLPVTITLTAAPNGTPVRITDWAARELLFDGLADPGATWSFPDPGDYAVDVEPPLPWLPAGLRFEVSE